MKYCYLLLIVCLTGAAGCKKDKEGKAAVVTIVSASGYGTMMYAAEVENPDPKVYSFLCEAGASSYVPQYSCRNYVYLKNLPSHLAVVGKKIKFSRFKDYGQPALLSSINHAHELDVYNPVEVQ